jgi:hypothetical protein
MLKPSTALRLAIVCLAPLLASACGGEPPRHGERTDLEITSVHLEGSEYPIHIGESHRLEVTVRNHGSARSIPVHVARIVLYRDEGVLHGGPPIYLSDERMGIPAGGTADFHPTFRPRHVQISPIEGRPDRARIYLFVYLTELERSLNGSRTYKQPYRDGDEENHQTTHVVPVTLE